MGRRNFEGEALKARPVLVYRGRKEALFVSCLGMTKDSLLCATSAKLAHSNLMPPQFKCLSTLS